jgi:hypothetical protein
MIFLLEKLYARDNLDCMKDCVYIPPSCRAAERHLSFAYKKGLRSLSKAQFVQGWCSLSFLYPGLHPDGFASRGSGWPKHFKPFAEEAWRRYESGELTDSELYCYQASKARFNLERGALKRKEPWLWSDHFAV